MNGTVLITGVAGHPVDDAESFAEEILPGEPSDWAGDDVLALVGEEFCKREPLR